MLFIKRVTIAVALLSASAVPSISAQSSPDSSTSSTSVSNRAPTSLPLPFHGEPLLTGFNVWTGSAFAVRTAAANEKVDGRFRIVAMQFSRTLFVRGGAQFSWLIEVLSGTVGAPSFRIPTQETNPEAFSDPKKYARYTLHHVYGVGFAPLSAQMVKPFTNRFATLLSGIAAGYALHHVSNGSLGESNPGMNSHLLFLKMSKSLRR